MDQFAQIAANGIGGRMELLEMQNPQEFSENVVALKDTLDFPIKTNAKMSSKKELMEELEKMKKKYSCFLENHAPSCVNLRKRIDVKNFICDGKKVDIPEYGGPMGAAKKTYIKEIEIPQIKEGQTAFIHFNGADYRAVVYLNNTFIGEHEGFFSPFEFEITEIVKNGENTIKVELFNDYIFRGNGLNGTPRLEGDKLYAATGLGWDDPEEGWHHCPAGMGIFDDVYIEIRNEIHISDIFVRPLKNKAELWIEVESKSYQNINAEIVFSVYGQNFKETVFENKRYIPETVQKVGMGDTLTEAAWSKTLGKGISMPLKHGKNLYKIPFEMKNAKLWELETPYLYNIQASVVVDGEVTDSKSQHFGMREFTQDIDSEIKGMFYLNGRKIRLRGANTMGFEQQDVMRGDTEQLIEDILLAKICNMNFLRLTQRPVQDKVYEYCDKLGLMTQSDLPLFGCMRRFKVPEGIRQAEETERIIRKHPCNVVLTYINEPFPNAQNSPHRHLERFELENFFACCDLIVKQSNPDRVIKHVDGDYDPPTESMPDNHCYPMWYNGHGIDIGKLHRGYWLPVLPKWYYGCGEYGAEGLDSLEVMEKFYPKEWMAEPFDPKNIVRAQTGDFHYFFYETPEGLENWIEKSQEHQALATKMMTEAFRRNNRMVSNAIHLFIDAWPSGWMKTIMDCLRNPKKAYFAYRDSLSPIMLSLRTDRFTYVMGETAEIEIYLCNDTNKEEEYTLVCELYDGSGKLIKKNEEKVYSNDCSSKYVATAQFSVNTNSDRESVTLKAILMDINNNVVNYSEQKCEYFADCKIEENDNIVLIEKLSAGVYEIAGETVVVKECGMHPLHFASRNSNHSAVEEFESRDFAYWYNKEADMITPIMNATFTAEGFTPVITSGNKNNDGVWEKVLAVAEKYYEGKRYVICQLDLRCENPVAKRFKRNLLKGNI
ncbi:MAG: hypothetical protein IKA17_03740 [Clostridia bacterium]|nr:hypothetical protein [Clostridia bacterium]